MRSLKYFLVALAIVELALQTLALVAAVGSGRRATVAASASFRILCLGESTTAAALLGEDRSWPGLLERLLNSRYATRRITVINRGKVGTNSGFVLAQLPRYLEEDKPDLVISMLGINDDQWFGIIEKNHFQNFINQLRVYKLVRHLWDWQNQPPAAPAAGIAEEPPEEDLEARRCLESSSLGTQTRQASQKACKKAIARFPNSALLHWKLGELARSLHQDADAVAALKKSIALNPDFEQGYIFLSACYLDQHKFREAEQILTQALRMPFARQNDTPARILMDLYRREGRDQDAKRLFLSLADNKEIIEIFDVPKSSSSNSWPGPVTRANYAGIHRLLHARGIPLVAMQYPGEDVEALKLIFPQNSRIDFVDNRAPFRKALAGRPYSYYFSDHFRPNWGHCTTAGNGLIAAHLADELRTAGLLPKEAADGK